MKAQLLLQDGGHQTGHQRQRPRRCCTLTDDRRRNLRVVGPWVEAMDWRHDEVLSGREVVRDQPVEVYTLVLDHLVVSPPKHDVALAP